MADWISFPKSEGTTSRQAHADLPENTYEREMGKEGFFGPATQFHHRHAPTGWTSIEGPLKPRAFDTTEITSQTNNPWRSSILLSNPHIQVRLWKTSTSMNRLVRNSDGDLLFFIHQGNADIFCDHGHMKITEGDYILLPRGTLWRIETDNIFNALLIEASGDHFRLPDKGLVGQHAIFDLAMLETPKLNEQFLAQQSETHWRVEVKRHNTISTINYPFNPLDAVGWHGTLVPVKVNWRDIRPLMSHRYHVPPSAHTTFVTNRFVICTFCPRPIESDPGALKVPFFHNNDDYDEVIFYHQGEFFSRDNIHPGMMTLHPSGLTHGPHPKAFSIGAKAQRKATNEVAVMIDTQDALEIHSDAHLVECQNYVNSWQPQNNEK